MTTLDNIVERAKHRLKARKEKRSLTEVRQMAMTLKPPPSFSKSIRRSHEITIIAELKQASPSAGIIRMERNIPSRVQAYSKGGAAALSILTEEDYFKGSLDILQTAKQYASVPLLRKDFIVDFYQIPEARAFGASAVLLIAALMEGKQLQEFIHSAHETGLDALVEIHDMAEADYAIGAGAQIIGINNRNLKTMNVDPNIAPRVAAQLKVLPQITLVFESGIRDPKEITSFHKQGTHSVLIGEALMRSDDPQTLVRNYVQAGKIAS